jgi:putative transcriptional regulator
MSILSYRAPMRRGASGFNARCWQDADASRPGKDTLRNGAHDLIPCHHPYPETLISYAAGTLPNQIACVVACHLSMCVECAKEIHWLEMLGGVLLSNLEATEDETPIAERTFSKFAIALRSYQSPRKPAKGTGERRLPLPVLDYLDANGAEISWKPIESESRENVIELPRSSGSIKLLRLSPGQHLPEYELAVETAAVIVLEGECSDSSGTYIRGDFVEWAESPPPLPMVAGAAECVCLMADQASG